MPIGPFRSANFPRYLRQAHGPSFVRIPLCVLNPTFADVAPTGASSYAGTVIDDPHFIPPALGRQHLGLSTTDAHDRRRRWPRRLSAAHTVLERMRSTLPLDNKPSLGGHPAKSTSAIDGERYRRLRRPALTRPELIASLTANSASAIASFNADLSVISRLEGHHPARAWRQGSAITSALIKKLTALAEASDARVEIVKDARVVLLLEENEAIIGVEYKVGGSRAEAKGNVPSLPAATQPAPPRPASSRTTAPTSSRWRRQTATTCPRAPPRPFPLRPRRPLRPHTKFLAAEAQFVCGVEKEDVVTEAMRSAEGGGRGPVVEEPHEVISRRAAFADDTGVPLLTFASYGKDGDAFGTVATTKPLCVATITLMVHSTMGALTIVASARAMSFLSPTYMPIRAYGPRGRPFRRTRVRAESLRGVVVSLLEAVGPGPA
ncbi:hypothetical protein C8R45DRAFT_1098787 [Mycena sanguinolenta]|nr:hypothetical protein C8R45DRAFT_1098787 [Mycena sanguinolenta]